LLFGSLFANGRWPSVRRLLFVCHLAFYAERTFCHKSLSAFSSDR
jgi:hypothetical protein